ncbi:hypothetical protein HFD88_002328 [Aspergillus terreus]|nr:hypothetical protein HFD88_002328 [Aspergillus terreus]
MKFSTALLASSAILTGVSAGVVWTDYDAGEYPKRLGHCWTCCKGHHGGGGHAEYDLPEYDLYEWLEE